jgi:hypothetical protein
MGTTNYEEDDYDVEPEESVDYETLELNIMFSQWLEDLMEMESKNMEAETKAITRAAGNEGMKVEDCFKVTTLTKSFPYNCYMNMIFDGDDGNNKIYGRVKFGGKATIYYITNDKVPMDWKEPTVLKAAFDFKKEELIR